MRCVIATLALVGMLSVGSSSFADENEICLEDVKCVVAGRPAVAEQSVDYKGGKVFFCCPNCKGRFSEDSEPFAAKANQQLVATGQAEQVACPLSGRETTDEATVKVDEITVKFCCANCEGRVEAADDEQKVALVFSNEAFERAFKVKKEEEEEDDS